MRRPYSLALLCLGALTMIGLAPLTTSPSLSDCENGVCTMRMTAPQLLAATQQMVLAKRYDEAKPMLAALTSAPEYGMETHFLTGYVAAETGDLKTAAREFRAVLRDRPDMVRARLELARVLMLQGKDSAADHHYRLAEEAADLPPEIARTIRDQRGVIRNRKKWHLNLDFGLAPDSNVNNATDARTIDVSVGNGTIPIELNEAARRRSGVGQVASVSSGVKLRLSDGVAMLIDADGQFINQTGKAADDVSVLLAAGPELTTKDGARFSVQALGVQRWYGGRSATTGGGIRASYQQDLNAGSRVGVQVDTRRIESGYGEAFGGWQHAIYASYERVVNKAMVASVSAFLRRDDLVSKAYSSTEVGGNVGIGGELPWGLNAGLSGGLSRVMFDAPLAFLSPDSRKDWRFNARAYLGARSVRVAGFSPSVTYTYNGIDSTVGLYRINRHRIQFGLARYF
ncbi:porin family protein [Sphingomonas profundi]|uniref:porin family protein n=1 Tax=Alterirhizorhabdus profundi TaxID=2681549 RepID=UPI0012E7A042|nr:porin family protein [Sphingomonas profundi]